MNRYQITQLDTLPPVECPCGITRRAFAGEHGAVASLHLVEVRNTAQTHHHQKLTEIYLVLEGEGEMELDGQRFPVKPMTAIYIKPGCRHRAIGHLKLINIPVPAFDPSDEWLDDEVPTSSPQPA